MRNSIHTANNDGYTLVTPVYAGMGASDPNGCLVRYVGSDVILAWRRQRWRVYRGQLTGLLPRRPVVGGQMPKAPAPLSGNLQEYTNLLGSGINFWAVNPNAMDNPLAFWKSLYPNTTTQEVPEIHGPYG